MKGWNQYRLEDVCDLITDGKHGDCKDESDSGYFFLSAKDVYGGNLNYENARQITQTDFVETHRRTKLSANDIVITNSGSIGRMAIAKDNELTRKTTFQKSVAIIKPKHQKVYYRYLYYELQGLSPILIDRAVGSAQTNLLLSDLRKFPIQLPDLPIQEKIASILSAYDDLIEVNKERIKILEETARELYKEWFVRMRFPGYKKAKFNKGIPEGWEVNKLGETITLNYGKALKEEERNTGDFLVYGSSGIVGEHDSYLVKAPGIVVGRKGNVGSVYWVTKDFYPIDTVFYVTTKISLYYTYFNLLNQHFIEGDAAVPGLNREQAYSNFILIPKKELLERFDNIITPLFQQINILQQQNTELTAIRDRLLPRLISGKLQVKV